MARGKPSRAAAFHCAMCDKSFVTRSDLSDHMQNHADPSKVRLPCPVCNFPFDDALALEKHQIVSQHMTPTSIACDRCSVLFKSQNEYNKHRAFPSKCSDAFVKPQSMTQRKGYVDPDQPKQRTVNDVLGYGDSSDVAPEDMADDSDTPTDLSEGEVYCHRCKKRFDSMGRCDGHYLGCVSRNDPPRLREVVRAPLSTVDQSSSRTEERAPSGPRPLAAASRPLQTVTNAVQLPTPKPSPARKASPAPAVSAPTAPAAMLICGVNGCAKAFRSEPGLNVHKKDAHGVGGKGLDFSGKDSYMLSQRARTQLQQEGLLRQPPTGLSLGRGTSYTSRPPETARASWPQATPNPPARSTPVARLPPRPTPAHYAVPQFGSPRPAPPPAPVPVANMATEMEQAKSMQGKTLRLLIQSDIFIHNDGKMIVCGEEWPRISVAKQPEVVGNFDSMVHLPKKLQAEYCPRPKTFSSDYEQQYPVAEFQASPPRNLAKPGLSVVVIACSKVVLADGLEDVVKIAAIDLVTCRILMNHLVCTSPKAPVKDWRTSSSGLISWNDMEQARKLGYKIFKGWSAARSALHKFIDSDTIVVGHNLRSDLDALRMVHGRAVDIAKVAEKAADGPLSKAQLSLDSMVRDSLKNTRLAQQDGEFGRDCLANAFAIRQLGLHAIKDKAKFDRDMRRKSQAYQLLMPKTAVA